MGCSWAVAGMVCSMQVSGQASAPLSSCSSSLLGLDSRNVAGVEDALECRTRWSRAWAGGAKRSMYTDVVAARVGRRPAGIPESHVSKPILKTQQVMLSNIFVEFGVLIGWLKQN